MEINARQLAERLAGLDPPELAALAMVNRLIELKHEDQIDAPTLMQLAPEIEAALHEIERVSETSRRILRQCLDLRPIPHPKVPLGF